MLERIEYLAHLSVARACGFAALGILTFFIGMSADLVAAFKSSGYLSMMACAVLLLKAGFARRQSYRNTEVWTMLKPEERPSAGIAQQVISRVLCEAYLRFARQAAILTALFLASSAVVAVFGIHTSG